MLTYTEAFREVVKSLSRRRATARGMGVPLWGVVSQLCGVGSTTACELVEGLGLDPHLYVLEPAWPDPAHQLVAEVCRGCHALLAPDDACPSGLCAGCEGTGAAECHPTVTQEKAP